MSAKNLSSDFLAEQMEVLEGWPPDDWDDAQDLSGALTEPQREAVWQLYDRVEDLMLKVMRRQLQSTDDVDPDKLASCLPIAFLRTLARYDPLTTYDEGDQQHLTTWIWQEARQQIRREIRAVTGQSDQKRRVERQLSKLYVITKQQEEREPTLDEKIEYIREHDYNARQISREALVDKIAKVEEHTGKTPSLDDRVEGDDEEGSTLGSLLPSDSPETVDVGEVGRIIAEETDRVELWERLQGEEPQTRSLSNAKARAILLELRARGADIEQIAWEHQTSPFVVSLIDEGALYDVDVDVDEVERYREAQGYDLPKRPNGALTDHSCRLIRRRYDEGATQRQLAATFDTAKSTIADVVKGRGGYDHFDAFDRQQRALTDDEQQDDSQGPALTDDEAREVRKRYEDEDITQSELAEDYPVSCTTINAVIHGDGAYSHLNPYEPEAQLGSSPDTTLSPEEVEEVRQKYREGVSYDDLAKQYEPAKTTIARMVRGEDAYSHLDAIDTRKGGEDPTFTDAEALEIRERYETEDVTQTDIADDRGVERTTISNVINGRRAYSHLSDENTDTDYDTESEDTTMASREALEAQVDRLTTIIERAAKDLSRSDAEEIREHFNELDLTREQLQGVHDVAAIDVERALMGEGYDDFDDLTA